MQIVFKDWFMSGLDGSLLCHMLLLFCFKIDFGNEYCITLILGSLTFGTALYYFSDAFLSFDLHLYAVC